MRLKQLVEVMRGTRWILLDQTFTAVVLDKVDAGTSGKIVIWGDGVGGDVMVQQAGDVWVAKLCQVIPVEGGRVLMEGGRVCIEGGSDYPKRISRMTHL